MTADLTRKSFFQRLSRHLSGSEAADRSQESLAELGAALQHPAFSYIYRNMQMLESAKDHMELVSQL